NIYRFLLLENAAFHAVIANAMAGAGAHWIVDRDQRQRRYRVTLLLNQVHFRNAFIERAALGFYSKWVSFGCAVRLVQTLGARVLFTLMADEAIVDLIERVTHRATIVREFEAVTSTQF